MTIHRRYRIIFSVAAGLALLSVAVIAMQGGAQPTAATTADHQTCTGDCATCPHAEKQPCPPDAHGDPADEPQSTATTVDAERCIGCVRCVNVSPEAFRMNPETRKAEVIKGADPDDIARGAQACPVGAITAR